MNKPKMTKVVCAVLIAASLMAVATVKMITNDRQEVPEYRIEISNEEGDVVIHRFERPANFGGCMLYLPRETAENDKL
ncbi:MAG: hypothetical protein IJ486_07005 [Firmicutes bacterium]|nr:hypothetical protein [Bacillota bacterium]